MFQIQLDSIKDFEITNLEISTEAMVDKFCRLDINMKVDNQRVDLEVQLANEGGNYPERSLYYWVREYSTALKEVEEYSFLLRTIVISIMDFNMFDCKELHSEF